MCQHSLIICKLQLHKLNLLSFFVSNQGMVDPGDNVTNTLKKEFGEEALNSLELSPEENKRIQDSLEDLFHHGNTVLKLLLIIHVYY